MRWRVLGFVGALVAIAVFVHGQPWPVIAGCAAYLLLVAPALFTKGERLHSRKARR